MKCKKIIIIGAFLLLIFATSIYTIVSAVESYQYDMDPANGIDIFEGFGAVLIMMVGGFVVFYELDLFYTVYYFFLKPKTVAKSVLNILSNLTLLLLFFSEYLINALRPVLQEEYIVPIIIFSIYVVLRMVYLCVIADVFS